MDSGSDSDGAPEELTAVQGVAKHEETSKVEKDSVLRCVSYAYFTVDYWMDILPQKCATLICSFFCLSSFTMLDSLFPAVTHLFALFVVVDASAVTNFLLDHNQMTLRCSIISKNYLLVHVCL
uniref:Uncharacterized protein n=1 Tax=Zea mays TaxID=4577 RepID=C0HIC3_MAIZE|nr:unknown [Zea mays]